MKGFIYLIESVKNNKKYLGSTQNPVERIKNHNFGNTETTKRDKPWRCLLVINVGTIKEARNIEKYIKSQKEKLIVKNIIKALNRYFEKIKKYEDD